MGLVAATIILLASLALPHRLRLIGVTLLLVPQIYIPGSPVSLAFLWTLVTCLAGFLERGRVRADSAVVVIMFLFLSTVALSLLWALPSGYDDGITVVVRGAVFLLWLREVIVVAREDPRLLDTVVLWATPGVAIQSLLTIAFRVEPSLEEKFLRSELATYTVGPAAKYLYSYAPNNVLDTEKAGGLLVNGNIASLFGGIAALVLLVAARRTSRRLLYATAALSAVSCVFAGSKAGLVLAISSVIAVVFLPYVLKRSAALIGFAIVFVMPLAFYLVIAIVEWISPSFYAASGDALSGRGGLWTRAAEMFKESPVLGVGFGGWTEYVGKIEGQIRPPHNVLIATWAYSGIVALVLAIVFIVVSVFLGLRVAAAQATVRDCRTAVVALSAIAWMFIQSMGENTALYGESLSMILFALSFAYLYAMAPASLHRTPGSTATTTTSTPARRYPGRVKERPTVRT
ncbi:hypothetical protein A7U43_25650 [Mycobacterium adipatum]|uniref:O-antigen ligase-related domain-containing protein n=1 Tax=Mycobacterium adipatum TaxID=1682113 RepID=A0A172UTE0_9MYCO|nr:O-antigen ligase family protein [Mycobacterium adipatum]ANE82190.1 hypothetical protein A7U43_25650 [Mycobacterium adipatum]